MFKRDTFDFCRCLPRLAPECAVFYVRFNCSDTMTGDELRSVVKLQVRSAAVLTFAREKLGQGGPHFCPYLRREGVKWGPQRFGDLCSSLIGSDKLAPVPALQSDNLPGVSGFEPDVSPEHLITAPAPGPNPGGDDLPPPTMTVEALFADEQAVAATDRLRAAIEATGLEQHAPPAPVVDGPQFAGVARNALQTPGFFCIAFPELHSRGVAEFTTVPAREKELQPTFKQCAEHILKSGQGHHFAMHPTWMALCYHELITPQILSLGGAYIDRHWTALTRRNLDAMLSSRDAAARRKVARGIKLWMGKVVGSSGYHLLHRNRILSCVPHFSCFWGGSPCVFHTVSTPGVHSHFIQLGVALLPGELDDVSAGAGELGGWAARQQRLSKDPRGSEALSAMRLRALGDVAPLMLGCDRSDFIPMTRHEHQRRSAGRHHHLQGITLGPTYPHVTLGAQTHDSQMCRDPKLAAFVRFWSARVAEMPTADAAGATPAEHPACLPTVQRGGTSVIKFVQRRKHSTCCAAEESAQGKAQGKGVKRKGVKRKERALLCRHDFPRQDYGGAQVRCCKRHNMQLRYLCESSSSSCAMTNTHWRPVAVCGLIGANHDVRPIAGDFNSNYLAKYQSKGGGTTKQLADAANVINRKIAPGATFHSVAGDSAKKVIQQAALRLQTNRAVSAQEMAAALLGLDGGSGDQYSGFLGESNEVAVRVGGCLGCTRETLQRSVRLKKLRPDQADQCIGNDSKVLHLGYYLKRMSSQQFTHDDTSFCGQAHAILRWMNFRAFAAWVSIEAMDCDVGGGSARHELLPIRPAPMITIVAPALEARYNYELSADGTTVSFTMGEAAARQLCALCVPHVEANDNVLKSALDRGFECSTWADLWRFYATNPCPWEVLYPGQLVGFEPPGIRNQQSGRKTVRRPVEGTRMPAALAIRDLSSEAERLRAILAAEKNNEREAQPPTGPIVDLPGPTKIPPEVADGIVAGRKAKRHAAVHVGAAGDLGVVLGEGPDPAPAGHRFHGSGGHLREPGAMGIALAWRKREVVEARGDGRSNLSGPQHESPSPGRLNAGQRAAFDDYMASPHRHCFLTGGAGTGKTMLTRQIVSQLAHNFSKDAAHVAAFTGVAAAINAGPTLHSLFRLTFDAGGKLRPILQADICVALARLKPLRWLVIDEHSMCSAELLQACSERCASCCGELAGFDSAKVFGGRVSVIFVGDPCQIKPVGGSSLGLPKDCAFAQSFFEGALTPGAVYYLEEQMRQGKGPLRDVLTRLKVGDSTHDDEAHLNEHCGPTAPGWRGAAHDPACVHLFDNNAGVSKWNFDVRRRAQAEQGAPAIRCTFASGAEVPVGGVPGSLWFQLGAPVMILRNAHVASGYVNGLRGWLCDIGWEDGEPEGHGAPPIPGVVLVMVRAAAVAQPSCFVCEPGYKVIVVTPIYGEPSARDDGWAPSSSKVPRRGLPVRNARGMTVHKSQGQSLDLACMRVDLARAKLASGYVGMPRATSTMALWLWEDLPKGRLIRVGWGYYGQRAQAGRPKALRRKKAAQLRRDFLKRVLAAARPTKSERAPRAQVASTPRAQVAPGSLKKTPWAGPQFAKPPLLSINDVAPQQRLRAREVEIRPQLSAWGLRDQPRDDLSRGWGAPSEARRPEWLAGLVSACGGCIGVARVIDYFGAATARGMQSWLRFLGLRLENCANILRQHGNTCAFVAAKVAAMQPEASWASVDCGQATSEHVWRSGREVLQMPADPFQFRTDGDIQTLLGAWRAPGRSGSALVASLDRGLREIACFARALACHREIISDTHLGEGRNRAAETLALSVVAGVINFPKRLIVNTSTCSDGGAHWFNVTFSLKLTD